MTPRAYVVFPWWLLVRPNMQHPAFVIVTDATAPDDVEQCAHSVLANFGDVRSGTVLRGRGERFP